MIWLSLISCKVYRHCRNIFLERVKEGIIFNLSDASQRSEEKHLEPSFKEANSAIFSTSAVNSGKPDPCRQDQPGSTVGNSIAIKVFLQKNANSYLRVSGWKEAQVHDPLNTRGLIA